MFSENFNWKGLYRKAKDYLLKADGKLSSCSTYGSGQQQNLFSMCPYTPIRLDSRFGKPKHTPLTGKAGFEKSQQGKNNICGKDSMEPEYTPTGVLGKIAINALDRLIEQYSNEAKPFSLSIHFNAPHPPMIGPSPYWQKYWRNRNRLYIAKSIDDKLEDSAYRDISKAEKKAQKKLEKKKKKQGQKRNDIRMRWLKLSNAEKRKKRQEERKKQRQKEREKETSKKDEKMKNYRQVHVRACLRGGFCSCFESSLPECN